jgi:membrane protease YdiL (CAAX protease family)
MARHPAAFGEDPVDASATGVARRAGGPVATWVRAHPIAAFLLWFFPVAWTLAFIPVVAKGILGVELPQEVFLSGAALLGGLLPVVVLTRMVDGPAGLDALRRRLLRTRASIGWYALALVAVPLLAVVLAVVVYGPPDVTTSTVIAALVNGLVVQTVLGFVAVNLWEETAWMGFVQARLQARRGVLLAAVLTAALFALQHVPLVVANGLANPAGLAVLALFFALAIPFRALVGWLYNRTGSLFLVGLLHAAGNATTSGSFADGLLPRLYGTSDVWFFHILANALVGLGVLAATRARLGLPARPGTRAEAGLAPAGVGPVG